MMSLQNGSHIVDVDRPETWPSAVIEWARKQMEQLDLEHLPESPGELPLPIEEEDGFRSLLTGYLVRAYHATRLLAHEVNEIRHKGLLMLSEDLVTERIHAAKKRRYLTSEEEDQLLAKHVARVSNRAGQVALFLSEAPMNDRWSGLANLLEIWGGEGIYMGHRLEDPMTRRLRSLGVPSVVVAAIDLSVGWRTHFVVPEVAKVFLGRFLNLEEEGASVHYGAPVPPDQILAILQPGHPDYDRHRGLPDA